MQILEKNGVDFEEIHYLKNGGDIEIHFFSDDDFDRILDLLRSIG